MIRIYEARSVSVSPGDSAVGYRDRKSRRGAHLADAGDRTSSELVLEGKRLVSRHLGGVRVVGNVSIEGSRSGREGGRGIARSRKYSAGIGKGSDDKLLLCSAAGLLADSWRNTLTVNLAHSLHKSCRIEMNNV